VEGTHPLAGRYRNKGEFIDSTFTRIAGVLPGGVKLDIKHLKHLYVDGETTIAELHSTSTTNEGADFFNDYGWVCRFQEDIMVTPSFSPPQPSPKAGRGESAGNAAFAHIHQA